MSMSLFAMFSHIMVAELYAAKGGRAAGHSGNSNVLPKGKDRGTKL